MRFSSDNTAYKYKHYWFLLKNKKLDCIINQKVFNKNKLKCKQYKKEDDFLYLHKAP